MSARQPGTWQRGEQDAAWKGMAGLLLRGLLFAASSRAQVQDRCRRRGMAVARRLEALIAGMEGLYCRAGTRPNPTHW